MPRFGRRSILKMSTATVAASSLPKLVRPAEAATYQQPGSYTAADLRGVLTPFGAVKAGNADGTIPPWTGGGYPMPAGYQPGDPRPIPFANETPVVVITSANLSQHQDKMSLGLQGVFQKYPNFTVQVFPTHRTAIAPQYVYDYIYKNASNAQLTGGGNGITGAYGGIPFPIPTNGHQVLWNHLLTWCGTTIRFTGDAYAISSAGQVILESRVHTWDQFPYYFENGENQFDGFFFQEFIVPIAPPYEAGGSILSIQPVNPIVEDVEAWEYLLGERRVRRAPELQFDTPNSLSGGVTNWDEAFIFSGKLVEYDLNYLGIKEVYIPYNTNKFTAAPVAQQYLAQFVNPDLTRWELHRCRVIEMTVKAGFRNVDARRILYCDEDTGTAVMGEVYDANGTLWKFMHLLPLILGDIPCVLGQFQFVTYDLHAGNYSAGAMYNAETQPQWMPIDRLPNSFFTPGHLAASAGGF